MHLALFRKKKITYVSCLSLYFKRFLLTEPAYKVVVTFMGILRFYYGSRLQNYRDRWPSSHLNVPKNEQGRSSINFNKFRTLLITLPTTIKENSWFIYADSTVPSGQRYSIKTFHLNWACFKQVSWYFEKVAYYSIMCLIIILQLSRCSSWGLF